jgi:hypothetical protein
MEARMLRDDMNLIDQMRGKSLAAKVKIMAGALPPDPALRRQFRQDVADAPNFASACTVIERYGEDFGLGLRYGDLTTLHTEGRPS